MLVKALGIIDVFAGLILIFGMGINFSSQMLIIFGIVLLAKSSLGLFKDFASWVDSLAGLTFILSAMISVPVIVSIIIGLLILQKGVFSFL